MVAMGKPSASAVALAATAGAQPLASSCPHWELISSNGGGQLSNFDQTAMASKRSKHGMYKITTGSDGSGAALYIYDEKGYDETGKCKYCWNTKATGAADYPKCSITGNDVLDQ